VNMAMNDDGGGTRQLCSVDGLGSRSRLTVPPHVAPLFTNSVGLEAAGVVLYRLDQSERSRISLASSRLGTTRC
jgi:hypothetical protein